MWECSDHQTGTPQEREVLFILVGMGQNLKPKFKDTAAVQRKGGRLVPSVFLAAHLNFATSLLHCIFRLALLPFSETLTLLWIFVILETSFFPCQSFFFFVFKSPILGKCFEGKYTTSLHSSSDCRLPATCKMMAN